MMIKRIFKSIIRAMEESAERRAYRIIKSRYNRYV